MIIPRCAIEVRPATLGDLPFIDALQKLHGRMVGWMPTKQLEGRITAGQVLVAWGHLPQSGSPRPCSTEDMGETPMPLGYLIGADRYLKRDDLGIVYQLNVLPLRQRNLIGASLVKEAFERAAYGCRLFCCWCAQDIDANYFWESLGFLPLAFRSGSRDKKRTHIFWQRRIREGDTTTPYWFPAQTSAGYLRENRLVLPIPPGTHWKDVMPVMLPGTDVARASRPCLPEKKKRKTAGGTPVPRLEATTAARGLRFGPLPQPAAEKPKREPRPKVKNDPRHVAAARELRDRYLEQFNSGLVEMAAQAKYAVGRALDARAVEAQKYLTQAA